MWRCAEEARVRRREAGQEALQFSREVLVRVDRRDWIQGLQSFYKH